MGGASMDAANTRRMVRERLLSRSLPNDFDPTYFAVGCPPRNTRCSGCGEVFFSYIDGVAHRRSGQLYWFHEVCEKLWQQERLGNLITPIRLYQRPLRDR